MAVHPIDFRYGTEEMKRVWEEETKLQKMLEVEAALAKAEAELGMIPKEAAEEINRKASTKYVKLERVKGIERETRHDVVSVVKAFAEVCEGNAGEYIHFGSTSNDIIDTAQSLQFKDAIAILEDKLEKLKEELLKKAEEHKYTVCIGRTHGQHAVPTTYGMKFALWAAEISRHIERLKECKDRLCVSMITGAVGTMAAIGENGLLVHKRVGEILGLNPVLISNQVVQRDRHAEFMAVLALIAQTLNKIGITVRSMQRSEIKELEEEFDASKQTGSSTMPHKRNPITFEQICGLSRVIKANALAEFDNIPLWEERDLTNSSPERCLFPESCILLDHILNLAIKGMKKLTVNIENVNRNLELTKGLIMAERVMMELAKKGMGRQTAHETVRKCAMKAHDENRHLKEVLLENEEVMKYLTLEDVERLFDYKTYIGLAPQIVDEVIKELKN
ncbi:MAG: adenylosuccinate lyase [Methanothermococcus sp.]|jgi:adenylosuccinate lyase|uniref:adenylosuccinate lyase n=1 Tax=Methanothermococcus TaxID=155862 RepID=UPI00036D08F1|nr:MULTISPECIES: adenylosuccinate lyase [Methanothermococcus]MDK2790688.1 adenylosuccinate lyase [Methanothermococcus sp.]MDK2987399.1 adenylosuccinate lyase [Methanothermococcus sp.]